MFRTSSRRLHRGSLMHEYRDRPLLTLAFFHRADDGFPTVVHEDAETRNFDQSIVGHVWHHAPANLFDNGALSLLGLEGEKIARCPGCVLLYSLVAIDVLLSHLRLCRHNSRCVHEVDSFILFLALCSRATLSGFHR